MTKPMEQPNGYRDYQSGKTTARRDFALGKSFTVPYGASPDYREGYEDQWMAETSRLSYWPVNP